MLNITNIFAGGHHSWLITDNIIPEKEDYEIPSPLEADNFSPTFQKSVDGSPKNLIPNISVKNNLGKNSQRNFNENLKFNLETLGNKINKNLNKVLLQVAYTDLKMSHRFIRFFIPHTSQFKDITYKDLYYMMNEFFTKDNSVIIFRLQDDNEMNFGNLPESVDAIFKDLKSNIKLLDINSNKKSFSLTIIYDINRNEKLSTLKSNIENVKSQNNILQKSIKKNICNIRQFILF